MSFRNDLTVSERALLANVLSGGNLDDSAPAEFAGALPLAARHRIAGVLARSVATAAGSAEAELIHEVRQAHVQGFLRQMRTLVSVQVALDKADLPFLILKGPALTSLYEAEWERHAGDLDVLMPNPETGLHAVDVLVADGWRVHGSWSSWNADERELHLIRAKDLALQRANDVDVELHWRASESPAEWPARDDPFAAAVTTSAGGHRFRTLGEIDRYVHLLSHGSRHGWRRLKWLVDMDRAITQMSPDTRAGVRECLVRYRLEERDDLLRWVLDTLGRGDALGQRSRSAAAMSGWARRRGGLVGRALDRPGHPTRWTEDPEPGAASRLTNVATLIAFAHDWRWTVCKLARRKLSIMTSGRR